ncbi:MAG: FAD-dependent oxidoreductase, partial [Dehalococcoidia bacterium]
MKNENAVKTKYLIIGNSAGGTGAAEAIRECDPAGSLLIVSDEPYPAYSRPLISEYLSRQRILETMLFRPPGFYAQHKIELLAGQKVKKIDPANKTASLENGGVISWQKLLLATGGLPIVPNIKGMEKEGVFSFTSLDDAKKIDAYLTKVSSAVVIGGGLIGISVSEALSKRGIIITVVEMKDRVLNTILDEAASAISGRILSGAGIKIITANTVAEIAGQDRVEGVVLANGQEIDCEMVVIAIGVLPRLDLVKGTPIKFNRGISIDRCMATSCPDVYACGDASEGWDFITGSDRLIPIWPNAYIGGRVAGYNMAGRQVEYKGGTAMNSINYFDMDISSAGLISAPDNNSYETLITNSPYQKLILKDNLVKGMIFVRDIEKSGIIYGLMRDGVNVKDFKQSLLSVDFGLIDLPRDLRQKRLGVLTAASRV